MPEARIEVFADVEETGKSKSSVRDGDGGGEMERTCGSVDGERASADKARLATREEETDPA